MLREAIRAEAETVVARNRANRAKLRKTLAAMTVAVCHTRPNPNLRGWQIPGLSSNGNGDNKSGGPSSSGSSKSGRGVGGGWGTDEDDGDADEGDDDEPDDDDASDASDSSDLNDDELMKEYVREMIKDGTAEDALGSWARRAARGRAGATAAPGTTIFRTASFPRRIRRAFPRNAWTSPPRRTPRWWRS